MTETQLDFWSAVFIDNAANSILLYSIDWGVDRAGKQRCCLWSCFCHVTITHQSAVAIKLSMNTNISV